MKKNGFTLMELLVYMAIVGIVVVLAGQVFSDSTKMRIRTQSMIEANQVAENLGNLIKDDIAQMGAKSAVDLANSTAENDAFLLRSEVYMPTAAGGTPDYSSFNLEKGKYGIGRDCLTFRRIKYLTTGGIDRFEEISWYATEDGVLYRSCQTLPLQNADISVSEPPDDCPADAPYAVSMAEGVSNFSISPMLVEKEQILPVKSGVANEAFRFLSRYGESGYAFLNRNPLAGGTNITLKNFSSNYDFENETIKTSNIVVNQIYLAEKLDDESSASSGDASSNTWSSACSAVNLVAGTEYEIAFSVPPASNDFRSFCPERDHMSVGFRKKSDGTSVTGLNDFLFYPPVTADATADRSFAFTPAVNAQNVCLTFTFAMYSPATTSGSISISSLKLYRKTNSAPTAGYNKADVKSFQLNLSILKNKEAGNVSLNIPTPSNGTKN